MENMKISEESKQAIRAALNEDPTKRASLPGFINFLTKIRGFDQPFRQAELNEFKKAHTDIFSQSVPVEEIKIRPIHANLIYNICSLLYKLSATNVFDGQDNPQPEFESIANILEIGNKLLQGSKEDHHNYEKYVNDSRKYAEFFRKYNLPSSMNSSVKLTGIEELIKDIEQKFMQRVRDYIYQKNPFEAEIPAENPPLIRNCKRFFVVCYFLINMDRRSDTQEEEGLIMFKLTKLNKEKDLEREFKFFEGKYEEQLKLKNNSSMRS